MSNMPRLALAFLALSIAVPGCKGSDCEQAYDAVKKCTKGDKDKIDKGEFVKMCEQVKADPKQKESFESDMACMKEDSCEKMEACSKAQRAKARAKKIAEASAAGKWNDAFEDCTLSEDYFADESYKAECTKVFANADKLTGDGTSAMMFRCKSGDKLKQVAPDFEKACKTLATGRLAAAQKAATAARDAGKNDYKLCQDLKDAAALAGGDAVAAAQKLCDELAAADDAKKATDEARANAAAKKTDVPFQCDSSAEQLAKIDSEWAKKTLDDVYKACFVELGAVVIAEKGTGKDVKYICPYQIKKITDAVAKYDLATKFPELADTMKKLPAKCQEKDKDKEKDKDNAKK
jgi:hypothetical protein